MRQQQSDLKFNRILKVLLAGSISAACILAGTTFVAVRFGLQVQAEKERTQEFQQSLVESLAQYSLALSENHRYFDALLEALRVGRKLQQQPELFDRKTRWRVAAALQQAVYIEEPIWRERNRLEGHKDPVTHVSWSPDGSTLASASRDNTVKLWKAETGEVLHTLEGHKDPVVHVSWRDRKSAV